MGQPTPSTSSSQWRGTWSTNNGNTWSTTIYSAPTRIGLLRILSAIIDGNITSAQDTGEATIYPPCDPMMAAVGYDLLPAEVLTRKGYDNKWYTWDN